MSVCMSVCMRDNMYGALHPHIYRHTLHTHISLTSFAAASSTANIGKLSNWRERERKREREREREKEREIDREIDR